ncbi:uncharacterized protein LOC106372911 [Brassica napus]|uniref:uncharacterized protein LOC106372911 n=2 Tax=Brassica TaxID=3705 RepID=UPI002078AF76|nr:uncharacterized protein LOC106372911 [Brassica napus]
MWHVPCQDAGEDTVLWRADNDECKAYFSSAKTWNNLRDKRNEVSWRKVTWFSQAVPRHAFQVWLAFRDRLSTGDRMKNWGIEQCCMLCGEKNETRDHMFFACPFSFTVWLNTAGKLFGNAITPDWNDTVSSLLQQAQTRIDHILRRMAFQTVIYSIWREHNSRRHGGVWG